MGAALATLLFAACSSSGLAPALVKVGDTSASVESLMGIPVMRQTRGLAEAWQYKRTKSNYTGDEYQVIWFHQGVVTAITTHTNDEEFQISGANFKEIRWQDAPALPPKAAPQ